MPHAQRESEGRSSPVATQLSDDSAPRLESGSPRPSFTEVEDQLHQPLLRYLQRLAGDRATAEDLLQDTLLRIARGLDGFAGRSTLKTWAFSIATRVAADYFRRPGAKARIVELDCAEEPHDSDVDLEERLIFDEMSACVREVVESLPEDFRVALVLHDFEGLTAAETAQVVGASLATAKIRIHRARRRLKSALEQECDFYHGADSVLRCDRKTP